MSSYRELYERWVEADQRDIEIEAALRANLATAWANGDQDDRYFAVHFVLDQVHQARIDILLEAIDDSDAAIAREAAVIAALVLDKLRPARAAIRRFNARYPEWQVGLDGED